MVHGPLLALDLFDWLVDPFRDSTLMQRGLLAGTFAAVSCGLVGVWVVLRGMTFLGDALAHGVLPGLAVAAVVGFNPTVAALASAGLMIAGISVVRHRTRLPEDAAIGLLFVGMLAAGVLIISSSRSYAGNLTGFLFGGITSVTDGDLVVGVAVAAAVAVAVLLGYRAFLVLAFHPEIASLLGLRPRLAHAALLVMITFAVVSSFTVVGTLLVFALITAPAAAAVQLVRRVPAASVLSVVLAEVSVVVGLLVSWHARLATGAAMAVSAVAVFAVAATAAELRRWWRARTAAATA